MFKIFKRKENLPESENHECSPVEETRSGFVHREKAMVVVRRECKGYAFRVSQTRTVCETCREALSDWVVKTIKSVERGDIPKPLVEELERHKFYWSRPT